MKTKKRLIDANAVIKEIDNYYHNSPFPHPGTTWLRGLELAVGLLLREPTVDAVEVVEYIELREQYDKIFTEFHELRDAFVDYVCGGVPNPSPFCKNKCPGCCDSYGWCKHDDKCKGFSPAKIFTDGDTNGSKQQG